LVLSRPDRDKNKNHEYREAACHLIAHPLSYK
jgi:hypothetical protein